MHLLGIVTLSLLLLPALAQRQGTLAVLAYGSRSGTRGTGHCACSLRHLVTA